jgi:hypothetical protein
LQIENEEGEAEEFLPVDDQKDVCSPDFLCRYLHRYLSRALSLSPSLSLSLSFSLTLCARVWVWKNNNEQEMHYKKIAAGQWKRSWDSMNFFCTNKQ